MQLINGTKMRAEYTLGLDPDGQEHIVVVVKGTFILPSNGQAGSPRAMPADEQLPLTYADEYSGEPGFSAVVRESDFAPRKQKCDVLFNGCAYASDGEPTRSVTVGIQVEEMDKRFKVYGPRAWLEDVRGVYASAAEPFIKTPFSYDTAYGGISVHPKNPDNVKPYYENPVGSGYDPYASPSELSQKLMPNTETVNESIKSPSGKYTPIAFGPISRNFPERMRYAGTYDDNYLEEHFPFLPPDFDDRYFQAAPSDQQIAFPTGGEMVVLHNLTPQSRTVFRLPKRRMPITFYTDEYRSEEIEAVIDTIYIEPERGIFTVIWRASKQLKKDIFEIVKIIAGRKPIYDSVRSDCLNATREDFEKALWIEEEDEDEDDDFVNDEDEEESSDDDNRVVIHIHEDDDDND